MSQPILEAAPLSPCISLCSLDEHGYCRGCLRSVEEITRWTRLSARQQWDVVAACKARRAARGPQPPAPGLR